MSASHIVRPAGGEYITSVNGRLQVPDRPIVSFIEGDGIGPDIMRAARFMWDSAIAKAYGGRRAIAWQELFAGEKANAVYNETLWLPQETVDGCHPNDLGFYRMYQAVLPVLRKVLKNAGK